MKKLISLFSIFLIIINVFGQDIPAGNEFKKIELEVASILSSGLFFTPTIGYSINKHSVFIWPKIRIGSRYGDSFGLIGGYKFYPNSRRKRVNFYFSYNSQFLREFINYRVGSVRYINVDNTLGYRFELKLFKEFYLTNEVGYGIKFNWNKSEYYSNSYRWEDTGFLRLGIRKRFRNN